MKSEHNNNGMPSPEDFWPEAKALLDNHFAKRKKIFLLFGMTLFFIISAIGFVFTNHKNNTTIAGLNKAKKEFKSNQLQPKNNTIKNIVKTKTELPFVNNSNEISTKLENQNIENKTDQKRNNFKNENLIIASTSKIENNRQSTTEAVKIDLSNTHQTVELPADNETVELYRKLRFDSDYRKEMIMRAWTKIPDFDRWKNRLDLSKHAHKITCPVTLIHGKEDVVIPSTESILMHSLMKNNNPKIHLELSNF
jgi:type III secretory pathway component EscV